MATNAPASRKTHIVRIVGTNRAGERITDIWVDVERMDIIKGAMQIPPDLQWQGWQRKLRWGDDPDGGEYFPDGPPSRLTEIVKVCDTDQDVNDPDEWVPIRVVKGMRSRGGGTETMGQGFMDRFVNAQLNNARVLEVRKIVHYDTNIDDLAEAAFDADPTRLEYVVSGDDYIKDEDTKDEDQFVDHEIITYLKPKTNNKKIMGLGRQVKLRNQYLIDESDPADGEVIGAEGFNPPYRLDPFQNIVNVKLTSDKAVLIGLSDFAFGFSGNFDSFYTEDGSDLDGALFDGNTASAASGFGRTVVTRSVPIHSTNGSDFVAFGKPRDGDACFIIARASGAIERGVMENGELTWSNVGTISTIETGIGELVYSCHFAGGAFFIGYSDFGNDTFRFAVSFDGRTFATGINVFPGATAFANGTNTNGSNLSMVQGGGVAYDSDTGRYVTVGFYSRFFLGFFDPGGGGSTPFQSSDFNFVSAVSSDGLNWSPRFDTTETGIFGGGSGVGALGGPYENTNCSVAFGNGKFVACGCRKAAIIDPDAPNLATPVAKAATTVSTNGINWSAPSILPGSENPDEQTSSAGCGIVFCKHRGLGNGIDGFFIAGALSSSGAPIGKPGGLHYSVDGSNWSTIYTGQMRPFYLSLLSKQTDNSIIVRK